VWRLEAARIIAGLTGLVRDVGLAEELAQDALVIALEQWPAAGMPANPGGWLMLTAKHRAIDRIRRNERLAAKLGQIGRELAASEYDAIPDTEAIDDDLLRLMFISCHPALSAEARIALTLRLLGGLSTEEIARGFLVPEPTIAKRIVRAKHPLADRNVPFEVPPPAGPPGWRRYSKCSTWSSTRASRPWPVTTGCVALMELHASRSGARLGPAGEPVPLPEQNRGRWDQLLIRRGFTALLRAEQAGGAGRPGPYVVQAAIAACHARARAAEETGWA
jgi:predicted RNA polymerase sigma factor